MTKNSISWGWLICALLGACTGGGGDTAATATSTTSSSSTTTAATGDPATSTTRGTTGTATETTTTTTGTTGTSTGCSFIDCATTEPPTCVEKPGWPGIRCSCDLWNDDCPDGQKCMPWANDGGSSWNAAKCTPLDPNPGKPGDPCTVEGSGVSGIDSCEQGSMCWNVDGETMMGYCVGLCDGSPESYTCAEPDTFCTIVNSGVLILCLPACDPLLQDCPNGDLCIYGSDGFVCVLDASGDNGLYADPCEFANACDPGLVCLSPEYVPECPAGGCCTPFCELDKDYEPIPAPAPNCPDPQMACLNWFEAGMAPAGQEKVGVCGIPM